MPQFGGLFWKNIILNNKILKNVRLKMKKKKLDLRVEIFLYECTVENEFVGKRNFERIDDKHMK